MALFRKDKGNLYLVDFENIHDTGLVGINTLKKNDSVIILFGSQNKTIGLGSHFGVMESKAKVETIALEKSAKNYLDFQLVTYLGFLIGTGKYDKVYVISNDTGYDSVVDFWKGRGTTIERVRAIKPELLPEKEADKSAKKPHRQRPNNTVRRDTNSKKQDVKQQDTQKKQSAKPERKNTAKKNQQSFGSAEKNEQKHTAVEKKQPEVKPAEVKPAAEAQTADVAQLEKKPQKSKQKAAVAEISEATRRKVRNAVKQYNIEANKYTVIYKAIALSKDRNAFKSRICSSFGENAAGIFDATEPIWSEYQASKQTMQ